MEEPEFDASTIGKVTLSNIKDGGVGSVYFSWNKVPGATGYKVYRSTNANDGFELIGTVAGDSKRTYTDTGLTSNQIYYYKVCAYVEVNGKEYLGALSASRYRRVS